MAATLDWICLMSATQAKTYAGVKDRGGTACHPNLHIWKARFIAQGRNVRDVYDVVVVEQPEVRGGRDRAPLLAIARWSSRLGDRA